jgi:hypothetical protein
VQTEIMADNNQVAVETYPERAWADLRECEKAWYMAYLAPIENGERQMPDDNDVCQIWPPGELQLRTVKAWNDSDELVRTTCWVPNEEQRRALLLWIEENPQII